MTQILKVKVIPNAKQNKILKLSDGSYKIYLTVPPIEGKANQKLIKLLSKEFNISKSEIEIIKGFKNKEKIIKIL